MTSHGNGTAGVAHVVLFGGCRLWNAGTVSVGERNLASEAMMSRLKRILRPTNTVLLVLFAGVLLSVSAQTQESEPLIIKANGHGKMISVVDDRKINSALVVLRPDGTALITVTADVLLQAQGTWKATAASPQEIDLKITGGAVKGEVIGSGKLLLTSDRKSMKELTVDLRSSDGMDISVTFVAEASEPCK